MMNISQPELPNLWTTVRKINNTWYKFTACRNKPDHTPLTDVHTLPEFPCNENLHMTSWVAGYTVALPQAIAFAYLRERLRDSTFTDRGPYPTHR